MEKELYNLRERKRKAETRRKIELGGLVIKGGLSDYPKAVILGAIVDVVRQLEQEQNYVDLCKIKGTSEFLFSTT